jgi:phosphatidylinositol 3-kinase
MKYIALNYSSKLLNDILKMTISINNILNDKISDKDLPFIYPFDTEYMVTKINNIDIISSTTKPYIVDVDIVNKNNNIKKVKFIIKKDKSLRKEQLISSLINILLNKLNNIDYYNIPTYRIIMLNKETGLIEYIEDAYTLRSICEKGFTLQNYILNMNQNNTLHIIKTRFAQSLAISSAIAYIIGLGDRHLDNIMINSKGQIFHIDYGYIMENPIKLFNTPEIKLTTDIIDFLGGINSIYYNEFKKLIVKIYNLYRANKNILYIYFKYICESKYLDWNTVSTKLDTKLMIGMKCKDVEITLINEIDSSNGIKDILSDMCHSYRQKIFS